MARSKVFINTAAGDGRTLHGAYSRLVRHVRGGLVCLGIAGTFIAEGRCVAQTTPAATPRLSVRPHEMATGTQNVQAGEQQLDSLPDYLVYVPKQCVGKRRVPLVVLLPGGGKTSRTVMDERWGPQLADKYGMILLVPTAITPGRWDVIGGMPGAERPGETKFVRTDDSSSIKVLEFHDPDVRNIDAALKQVLRKFAIDPDKIAVGGMSDGASYSLFLGRSNLDVFSRIGAMSGLIPYYGTGPQNKKVQFFLSGSVTENRGRMVNQTIRLARVLRKDGYAVETILCLREHVDYLPDYDYMWSWLAKSWGMPSAKSQFTPVVSADSDPVLTVDALTRMTAFWNSFMQEPDSIGTAGRLANQERINMPIGQWPVSVIKANMTALAAKYPAVAADLQKAGLTARQEDTYRAAIARVVFTKLAGSTAGPIAETSVLGKNMTFRNAHDKEFEELAKTGIWINQ